MEVLGASSDTTRNPSVSRRIIVSKWYSSNHARPANLTLIICDFKELGQKADCNGWAPLILGEGYLGERHHSMQ